VLSGVLFGCVPAWHAAKQNISDLLKEGGRSSASTGHNRLRRVLVVAEFALALILVGGAGLILRSFWNVTQVDLGIRRDHVLTFNVPIQNERTRKVEQIRAVYRELVERIGAVPGVLNVGVAPGLPTNGAGRLHFAIVGQPAEEDINKQPETEVNLVTPGYFPTYGIRLTRGRYLDGRDLGGAPRVAMVSESFVRQYLPGVDPLTQRLKIVELIPDKTPPFGAPVEWQIVGVFHDVQYESHPTSNSAEVDLPFDQSPWPYTTIGVRTNGDPTAVRKSIAAAVRSVNPDYPMTKFCRVGAAFGGYWDLWRDDVFGGATESRDGNSHGAWGWQLAGAETGGQRRDVGGADRNGGRTPRSLPGGENAEEPFVQRGGDGCAGADWGCGCAAGCGACGVLRAGPAGDED
jgi:putative ABC transport system permease protein